MTVSDWINHIRWKYFTNNRSGLIFKELMGEFRAVEQMTENKRYYRDFNGDYGTIIRDRITNEEVFEFGISDSKDLCDLLNEQEETIQTQKDYIIRMGHGTIFEEMKRLKERNQRQYKRLKEITDLMMERDWKSLEKIVKDWEQAEKQLEREWDSYGDV